MDFTLPLHTDTESHGESGVSCRQTVFTHCVNLLNSEQLQSQTAQELVGKLLVEVIVSFITLDSMLLTLGAHAQRGLQ